MNFLKPVLTAKRIHDNPIGSLVDLIYKTILKVVSPVPIPDLIASQLKTPIIGFVITLALLFLFFLIVAGTILLSPWIIGEHILNDIKQTIFPANTLNIPVNTKFASTTVPRQNPLGGSGFEYSIITAYFLDTQYYLNFGKNHTGIDLVPSDLYYKNSQPYQQYKQVIVYSTIDGNAIHYVDSEGGETVEVTNKNQNNKVKYIHFKQVLIESGNVVAGTPLGIMGSTGFATGEHVHYEILLKDGTTWRNVNPLNYIE